MHNIGPRAFLATAALCASLASHEEGIPAAHAQAPPALAANVRRAVLEQKFSAAAADWVAAVNVEGSQADDHSFSYRETYPGDVPRLVSYSIEENRQYSLSAEERDAARLARVHFYRLRVTQTPIADGAFTTRVAFFVPYDELPPELRAQLQPAAAWNWLALFGIRTAVAQATQTSGIEVIFTATLQESAEQLIGLLEGERSGSSSFATLLSSALDIWDAHKLKTETEEYKKILDELEDCARNPTHGVPVPEAERQRQLDTLKRIRSELMQITAVRFLNVVADYPLSQLQAAGGPAAGLLAVGLSVALKPFAAWSDRH